MIGKNIDEESAENMKRALELGCEIGNHSLTHSRMSQMDEEQVKTEILATSKMIEQITGQLPKFFRPPYIDVKPEMYDWIDLEPSTSCMTSMAMTPPSRPSTRPFRS